MPENPADKEFAKTHGGGKAPISIMTEDAANDPGDPDLDTENLLLPGEIEALEKERKKLVAQKTEALQKAVRRAAVAGDLAALEELEEDFLAEEALLLQEQNEESEMQKDDEKKNITDSEKNQENTLTENLPGNNNSDESSALIDNSSTSASTNKVVLINKALANVLNLHSTSGTTALHEAAFTGNKEIVRIDL